MCGGEEGLVGSNEVAWRVVAYGQRLIKGASRYFWRSCTVSSEIQHQMTAVPVCVSLVEAGGNFFAVKENQGWLTRCLSRKRAEGKVELTEETRGSAFWFGGKSRVKDERLWI